MRALAAILLDLHSASARRDEALKRADGERGRVAEDRHADQAATADDEIWSLRAEWQETFRVNTGIRWDRIEAAIQSAVL